MTTPILHLKEIPDGMEKPQLVVNEGLRVIESSANGLYIVNLASGDVTISDSANADPAQSYVFSRYFVYRAQGHVVGRDLTVPPKLRAFVVDNAGAATVTVRVGSASVEVQAGAAAFLYVDGTANGLKLISVLSSSVVVSGSVVVQIAGISYAVDAADNTKYLSFTNATAKTISVRKNGVHALPANFELNIRNAAEGAATIVPAEGVTVTAPYGGTLVIPPHGTVTLKRVANDNFHLIGVTVPA